jgi:hypothetical protein
MGLLAYICKSNTTDCSNEGISSWAEQVCITNVEGPFEPDDKTPSVLLLKGNLVGIVHIVPEALIKKYPMFGGCFVHTADSRLYEAVEKLTGARFYGAISLHDRIE